MESVPALKQAAIDSVQHGVALQNNDCLGAKLTLISEADPSRAVSLMPALCHSGVETLA